ncbi:MAG: hypothetical protein KVP17_002359 [Porospora cf. gigantea B]|uniref:uncharacterized protein n=1 Tax=Porospora cf. gigantea B TaxID=2853592 RepID=UPI003571B8E8|nr:MAG: hypothetical protein KVP17_002359 [Porospora cf. gigantea B]
MSCGSAQAALESHVQELWDLEEKEIFDADEIRAIAKRRRHYEFRLVQPSTTVKDYLDYVVHETNLELTRRKRSEEKGWKTRTISDRAVKSRIGALYRAATQKFPNDVKLWNQRVDWHLASGNGQQALAALTEALAFHPRESSLWLLAAHRELQCGDLQTPRRLLQTALRVNDSCGELWSEYLRFEIHAAHRMCQARLRVVTNRSLGMTTNEAVPPVIGLQAATILLNAGVQQLNGTDVALFVGRAVTLAAALCATTKDADEVSDPATCETPVMRGLHAFRDASSAAMRTHQKRCPVLQLRILVGLLCSSQVTLRDVLATYERDMLSSELQADSLLAFLHWLDFFTEESNWPADDTCDQTSDTAAAEVNEPGEFDLQFTVDVGGAPTSPAQTEHRSLLPRWDFRELHLFRQRDASFVAECLLGGADGTSASEGAARKKIFRTNLGTDTKKIDTLKGLASLLKVMSEVTICPQMLEAVLGVGLDLHVRLVADWELPAAQDGFEGLCGACAARSPLLALVAVTKGLTKASEQQKLLLQVESLTISQSAALADVIVGLDGLETISAIDTRKRQRTSKFYAPIDNKKLRSLLDLLPVCARAVRGTWETVATALTERLSETVALSLSGMAMSSAFGMSWQTKDRLRLKTEMLGYLAKSGQDKITSLYGYRATAAIATPLQDDLLLEVQEVHECRLRFLASAKSADRSADGEAACLEREAWTQYLDFVEYMELLGSRTMSREQQASRARRSLGEGSGCDMGLFC